MQCATASALSDRSMRRKEALPVQSVGWLAIPSTEFLEYLYQVIELVATLSQV
jgi:hypothetical protein